MLRRRIAPGGTDADVTCPANIRLDQYPGPIRLGRHTNCEVRCLSQKASGEREVVNAAVSRWHAEIARTEGGGYVVRDKSANGTFVNAHRVSGNQILATGDVIILGMPTYKATLEPATEIVNPFIFEFVAEQDEQDASALLAKHPAPVPIVTPSGPRLAQSSTMARVSATTSPSEGSLSLRTLPQPDAGSARQSGRPLLKGAPSILREEGDNKETQPYEGGRARLEGAEEVPRRVSKLPSNSSQATGSVCSMSARREPMINAGGPGVRVQMNGREILQSELPLQVGGQEEPGASTLGQMLAPGGAGVLTGGSMGTSMSADESASEAPFDGDHFQEGRADSGESHVRLRMLEAVRAKERADARGEPSNKRRNAKPPSEDLIRKRAKRSRAGAGDGVSGGSISLQAIGTPLSLADDCALLDIPGVGGLELQPTFGLRSDPDDGIMIDFPNTPNDPLAQDLVGNVTVGPPNTETPAPVFLRAEPEATAEPLGGASTSSTVSAKDASASRTGEAELLDMLGEEMQCVICQNFLCAAHALPCSHTFCGDCLSQWLSKKPHCPTCRRPVGIAAPTPIHNIDSIIERAASRCMSPEEKTEFDKRRGAIKQSKKLEPSPANTAAVPSSGRARAIRISRPAPTLDEIRSGTLQAVSARLDEAMTSLSVDRARELVSRVQERRRMMTDRRGPPPLPLGQGALRQPPRASSYAIDRNVTGESMCAICNSSIARGQFRLTKRAPEAGQRFHLGCLQNQASIQLEQISGMEALSPELQNMVKAMFRARASASR